MVMPGVTTRKASEKRRSLGGAALVERVPGDEHGHDDRLAAAGGDLAGQAEERRAGGGQGVAEIVEDAGVAGLLGGLGQVDEGLQGLDLAEEQPALPAGPLPVFLQAAGDGCDVRVA